VAAAAAAATTTAATAGLTRRPLPPVGEQYCAACGCWHGSDVLVGLLAAQGGRQRVRGLLLLWVTLIVPRVSIPASQQQW
jgi:hypothetical protein